MLIVLNTLLLALLLFLFFFSGTLDCCHCQQFVAFTWRFYRAGLMYMMGYIVLECLNSNLMESEHVTGLFKGCLLSTEGIEVIGWSTVVGAVGYMC